MIRRLKYNAIDFEKYNQCLENSVQKNWYAKKEILDHLCESWELLVYKDYEAVMPVPIKKKMGFSFVSMPLFCQQLGIFSAQDDSSINSLFFKYLKKRFLVFTYSFNYHNQISPHLEFKKNYSISVSEYELLKRKKYFKGRKSTVKWAQNFDFQEINYNKDYENFIQNNHKGLDKKKDYDKFIHYLRFLVNKKTVRFCGAFSEQKIISLAILVEDTTELSLLSLVNNENFKTENAPSFLIDKIISKNIHSRSFNFMGGNIRGIEVFFKSFGAELQKYSVYENKIIKKILLFTQ